MRADGKVGESSATVAQRVLQARRSQTNRLSEYGLHSNSEVAGVILRRRLPLPKGTEKLESAVQTGRLSARGVDKVLRIAWTIADLYGAKEPSAEHLDIALAMRRGEY